MANTIALKAPVAATRTSKVAPSLNAQFQFKGRNATLRGVALAGVATCAYVEGKSRADVLAQVNIVLGKAPTDVEVSAARVEYVVGRVAQKTGDNALPIADQLAHARNLVTSYAAPAKDGVKANKLRKGQLGRRTPEQHKAIRAAEETFSLIIGELGHGKARTMAEKNKRAASHGKGKGKLVTPTHAELTKSSATPPKTPAEACEMIALLSSSLLAYSNKYAGLVPTSYGQSIVRFHGAIMQLEKDRVASAE